MWPGCAASSSPAGRCAAPAGCSSPPGGLRAAPGAGSARRRLLRAASWPGPSAAQGGQPVGAVAALDSAPPVARRRLRRGAWAFRRDRAGAAGRAAIRRRGRAGRRAALARPARRSDTRPDRDGGGPPAAGADARTADDRAVPQRRQAEALRLFQEGRRVLAEELGIDPGADLSRIHQQVLTADPAPQRSGRRGRRVRPDGGAAGRRAGA